MSNTPNILNLDDLVIDREVIMAGKKRKLNSMTVEQFIKSEGLDKRIEGASQGEQINILVEQIVEFMENTTVEELRKLTVVQLFALLAFIRGSDAEGAPKVKEAAGEGNEQTPKS